MNIKVEGMDELNKLLKKMPNEANNAVMKSLEIAVLDLQGKSQRLAPVNMGDLQGSAFTVVGWKGDISQNTSADKNPKSKRASTPHPKKMEAIVGFTEPYALRQHEEMGYNHPQGGQAKYLEQPLNENIGKYTKDIGDEIRKAVDHK